MDVPINAEVSCADGGCGQSICVIVNPVTDQITHVVVREKHAPHTEHVVPIELMTDASPHQIHLRCAQAELAAMPNFVEQQFVRVPMPFLGYGPDHYLLWPYVIPDGAGMARVSVRHELVPADELALHRGSGVEATDGHAGEVDEFLIDPADGHITHLILREGHVWDRKDVTIPVSQIDRIETDTIYLKLDKHGLGQLPVMAIRRRR